jgi:hypothetical protein
LDSLVAAKLRLELFWSFDEILYSSHQRHPKSNSVTLVDLDATMAFTYHAVAKDHIRLLKVPDPSIQSQNERLEFTIDAVPLRSAPAYSADPVCVGIGFCIKGDSLKWLHICCPH